ncbi:hypothetical protein QBC37DRAFT_424279 [Rhypophila decipiens]|uniref:Uncharacterized protein n=1 Tax=Rhypophila decipiens TaxID=261697 RepID=A0AAN7B4U5_9PEZI|nr:hypothetical protein QBC37DRAFT_424279 [Rhypophila decipiens]
MVSISRMRNRTNPDRIQKPQYKSKHPLLLGLSKTAALSHSHQRTSELGDMASIAVSPTNGERPDSCSFRTRLYDDGSRDDELDDITYTQPIAPLGRTLCGNPHINPADMLFPATPMAENAITPVHTPMSESNDPMSFSFMTVEEHSDTEMVDASNGDNTTPNNTRKRKSISSPAEWSQPRKRVAKFTLTPRTPRLGPQRLRAISGMEDEDISDDWSLITEAEMARIPVYNPDSFMNMKQSVQAYLLRRALCQARSARKKVRTFERSCRTLFQNAFEPRGHVGPTKCISVGSAW